METLEQVLPYVSIAFLVILGLFILFGVLFGLGRGFKRSLIRLLTVLGFLLLAFFLTPLTARWVFSWNINIAGHTPAGWVDVLIEQLQNSNTVAYLVPVMPYFSEFAVALALAIVNIVLFVALYLVVKPLSWIVYAIIAPHAAPKKDANGNKVKKHAWAGALLGLVQGLVLFFFFMLPFNGLLGVVSQAANYEPANADAAQPAQVQDVYETEMDSDDGIDVLAVVKQIDQGTAVYTNILRYTGMEFLTKQAFRYETLVRVDKHTQIMLRDDLVTGIELVNDVMAFSDTIDRIDRAETATGDIWLAWQEVNANDYAAARNLVNKVFSLNILKIGDTIMGDLDKIMAENFGEEAVMLENSHIYRESGYGLITALCADENHRDEFLTGLRAMTGYLAKQKLNIARNDLINVINLWEKLNTWQITTPDGKQPIMVALTRQELPTADLIDRLLATVGTDDQDDTVIDVLFDSVLSFSTIQMMGAKGAENFVLYSNYFDDLDDEEIPGLSDFARTFASGFFGEKALVNHEDIKQAGHWYKLKDMVKSVLYIVRDHCDIADELDRITAELRAEQPDASEDLLTLQAIVRYVAGLTDAEIDNLAKGLHHAVFMFSEVTDFLNQQITNLPLGDFQEVFSTLLSTDELAVWQSTLKGLKNTMVALDKVGTVIQEITDLVANGIEDMADVWQVVVELDSNDVANIVYEVLQIDSVGEKLNEVLQDLDLGAYGEDEAVQAAVDQLTTFLAEFNDPDKTEEAKKAELEKIFANLWTKLQAATPSSEGIAA